jgi:hypothetical protein
MSQVVASLIAKIGADTSEFVKGSNSVLSGMGKLALSGAAVTAAFKLVEQGFKETVTVAQAYDQSVRDLMLSTGGSAEATSRLIQVVDDAGVSYDTLKTAMKFAVKNGIEPSTESLMKLSDQYLALAPGVERGQFLLERFGKSGLNMARVMELGSSAIEQMNGSIEAGLVLTEENIKASEEYRLNLDTLADSVESVKIGIGNGLIPALNDAALVINANIKGAGLLSRAWGSIPGIMEDNASASDRAAAMLNLISDGAAEIINSNLPSFMKELPEPIDSATQSYIAMAKSIQTTQGASEEFIESQKKQNEELQKNNAAMISLAMDLTAADQDYAKSQADIQTQIADLSAEKASMYSWEVKDIETIQGKIDDLSKKYNENAEEHSKRTQQIILDMTLEKIAMSDGIAGFNEAEAARALAVAETAGAVEAAAIREAVAMDQISTAMADPNQKLLDMKMLLESMVANGWNINVAVIMQGLENLQGMTGIVQSSGAKTKGVKQAMAGGGSFTVPPEYGYEGFALGGMATATAGERVTVGTAANNTDNSAAMAAMIAGSMPTERGIGRAVARELQKAGMGAAR